MREVVGESPAFAMSYDNLNPTLIGLYLPVIRDPIRYIDSQFDNRVLIDAALDTDTFSGNTIGSASSTRYTIPFSVFVEGLRAQSVREDSRFADALPESSLSVLYDGSASTETFIRVTDGQIRAIFDYNVVPRGQGVSITFNIATNWNIFDCEDELDGDESSLIDVAILAENGGTLELDGVFLEQDFSGSFVQGRLESDQTPIRLIGDQPTIVQGGPSKQQETDRSN